MRPFIALIGSAGVLLSVHFYLRFAESLRAQPIEVVETATAPGVYSAEITLTFDAQADEFSLEPTSLVFRHQQQELLKLTGTVAAGTPLVVDQIPDVVTGLNEFYFECVPREEDVARAHAVRVRLFRDGTPVAETTLWSEPGQVPRGRIVLNVEPGTEVKHDHPK